MVQLSHRALTLASSSTRKLAKTARSFTDVDFIALNIGQPDVPTPDVVNASIQRWSDPIMAYGASPGEAECREAAAAYHSRWGKGLTAEHVLVTTGGSEGLLFALCAVCDPGDTVLVPQPYYTNYNGFANMAGVQISPITTRVEDGFALPDNATLSSLITERTRALLFSNPGNPTGAVYDRDTLERVVRWAREHNLFVIADEVYRRIWFNAPPASALEIEDAYDHVICIDSMSKTFSACGLRLGFLISRNAELMERVERLAQARLSPQPLAQAAATAALKLPESYYDSIRDIYRRRVDALMNAVDALPGVSTHRPEGAFYAMLELPVEDAGAFGHFLVTEFRSRGQSVILAPGSGFYADPELGKRQVRVAAVKEESILQRAVEILGEALLVYRG